MNQLQNLQRQTLARNRPMTVWPLAIPSARHFLILHTMRSDFSIFIRLIGLLIGSNRMLTPPYFSLYLTTDSDHSA